MNVSSLVIHHLNSEPVITVWIFCSNKQFNTTVEWGNIQRRWKKKNILSIFLNQNGIICKNDVFFLHWGEGLLLRHFLTLIKRRVQDGGVLVYCILRELYISGSLKDSRDMASTMSSMKVLKLNRTYFMFFFIYIFTSIHKLNHQPLWILLFFKMCVFPIFI